jgi:CheY-like chemotaxis protein
VVEDSPAVRQLTAALLEAAGYAVETAEDGTQALAMLARDPERYDLLFTDMVLPDVTGLELVAQARASRPPARGARPATPPRASTVSSSPGRATLRREAVPQRDAAREGPRGARRPGAAGRGRPRAGPRQDDLDAPIG